MLTENLVTASLQVEAQNQVLLDMNHDNACAFSYPASLCYRTISTIKGRRIKKDNM
jgi:hypothetical protein